VIQSSASQTKEMRHFTKNIAGVEFGFQGKLEGEDEVCWISVDSHRFRMTIAEDEKSWEILQQVPEWIKKLEAELGNAIDEAYC
jgi:hypothetical protein